MSEYSQRPPFSSPPPRRSARPLPIAAASFGGLAPNTSVLRELLGPARASVPDPTAAIVFAGGALGERAEETLHALRHELGDIPMILGAASGVLCERGEYEGISALSGLLCRGGSMTPLIVADSADAPDNAVQLLQQMTAALGDAAGTVALLAEPQALATRAFDELTRGPSHATIIGGGTLPKGAWAMLPGAPPVQAPVVGFAIRGIARPAVTAASGCRLLAPLAPITESRGAMITRIGDRTALEALSACTRDLTGRPLVLAVIGQPDVVSGVRGSTITRGIRGIDPTRGAVVVSDEASAAGQWMTFAVCDGPAARAELTGALREVARQMAGAAPQFGLFFNCASRGSSLYGESNVDSRIVRERFAQVPFAGMFSSFEIGPFAGRTVMHLYTGVVAMFGAPS